MPLVNPAKLVSFIRNSIKALILGARIFMVHTLNRGGGTSVGGGFRYFAKKFSGDSPPCLRGVLGNSLQSLALSQMIVVCV
jgi:hypothetical protein